MLVLKPDVDPSGVKVELLLALGVADAIFASYGERRTVVTSLCDGKHSAGSLHPRGLAADLRTAAAGMSPARAERIARALRLALPDSYQVLVERDHIHLEFDPPRPATSPTGA